MDENEHHRRGGRRLGAAFSFLTALRHHYVGRVSKITPSGRLQSAVLVILDDAVCVCSNRGGLHRCIPLGDIDRVVLFSRGRLLFILGHRGSVVLTQRLAAAGGAAAGASHHNLLLSVGPNVLRVVQALRTVYEGAAGRALPLEDDSAAQDGAPPPAKQLGLRPMTAAPGRVPRRVVAQLRVARARVSLDTVHAALNAQAQSTSQQTPAAGGVRMEAPSTGAAPPPLASRSSTALTEQPRHPKQQQHQPPPDAVEVTKPGVSLSDDRLRPFQWRLEQPITPKAAAPVLSNVGHELISTLPASTVDKRPREPPAGVVVQPGIDPWFATTGDELIIVTVSHPGVLGTEDHVTFPAHVSLLAYFLALRDRLPGATQPPLARVEGLVPATESGAVVAELATTLVRQTLRAYARRCPHAATVERAVLSEAGQRATAEGVREETVVGEAAVSAYWAGDTTAATTGPTAGR